jgi:lysophospholipase L1-like esterase
VPGATSSDLLSNGTLDRAVTEITTRRGDADPNNDVQLVTLEIGGNDLLGLFSSLVLTGICPDVQTGFRKPECIDALRNVFERYSPNLTAALERLHAADATLPVLLSTQYNPLEHIPSFGELGDLSIEGLPDTPFPEGMNDLIRQVAAGRDGVTVVDIYAAFRGRTLELISPDIIHPNDAGYAAMADAEIAAIAALRGR